ncbi:hypothetical protein [Calothrix sp. UHCC 0171]|uniref:hypothetical protein n=1 Tax=Calothrix sp. UHCC 0171 TaxID=3110245 RepID=UPI002B20F41A|nr:hypothetical protein [Calothrix sp. UHCC 0171]MEA5572666.1 hypothetical protein [Calothrix sp. UHCC 0171]
MAVLVSLALLFGIHNYRTVAQTPHTTHKSEISPKSEFQRIEQPLWGKVAVTTFGLGLIGVEIWWFLLSKSKSGKTGE